MVGAIAQSPGPNSTVDAKASGLCQGVRLSTLKIIVFLRRRQVSAEGDKLFAPLKGQCCAGCLGDEVVRSMSMAANKAESRGLSAESQTTNFGPYALCPPLTACLHVQVFISGPVAEFNNYFRPPLEAESGVLRVESRWRIGSGVSTLCS